MAVAVYRGESMKKLLFTEGLIACFFLALLLGLFGKYLGRERDNREVNGRAQEEGLRKDGALLVYPGQMQEQFSPLNYQFNGEENILAMCFSNLLSRDEKGERNNKSVSEKWTSEDMQFAHISSQYDEKKGISTVTIQVNPKAKTISGKKMGADDLLFNFYLRCDTSGTDEVPFHGVRILGQEEYIFGTKDLEKRKRELEQSLKKPSGELKKLLKEEIVEKELLQELQWVKGLYQDAAYDFITEKYAEAKDLFAYYYAYRTKYSSQGKTEEQVFSDILKQYDWNYTELSKVTEEEYTDKAFRLALSVLLKDRRKDTVSKISGIQKKDETTVVVQIKGGESEVNTFCDMWILPLEEYGNETSFDEASCFGFQKGEADIILKESFQKYSGTGAYYSKSINEEKIVLRRNPNYFGKKAEIGKISVLRKKYQRPQEIVEDILSQSVDIVVVKESTELDKLLTSNGTGASYSIRKIKIDTNQPENCFLYRTSYVNAPSIPKGLTEYRTLFQNINQLKVNNG